MQENRLEVQQTQRLSQQLQTTIHLLSCNAEELTSELRKAAQENPALEIVPPAKGQQDFAMRIRTRYRGRPGGAGSVQGEQAAPADATLDELEQQLRLSSLDEPTRRAAMRMLHMLTPRGYFPQEPEAFAAEAGIPEALARRALEAVQMLEPAGVGARTVEECLELQLRERPEADSLCRELVRDHLADIARGNLKAISKATGAGMARVRQCIEVIRSLTPAPCSLYEEAVRYIVPEFSVEAEADGRLCVQFHSDYFPTLRLDESFSRLAEGLEGEERAFAQRMQAAAARMVQAIDLRQSTMEKLAAIIVREQRAFFLGEYSLLPLRIDETASEIGVHETTVYRAVQGKYLYCSRGTFPLSYFFQKEISGGTSTARAKELIAELCSQNERISDRAIAEALAERGITLSRRTVAKYRAQMDIDSSFRR